jgi:uncharacterized protein YprB with RNaseH-like and TPR domain
MESILRKRLKIIKSRARQLRDHYVDHRQYTREDYGPPCTLTEAAPGRECRAGGAPFYQIRTVGDSIAEEARWAAERFARLSEQPRWPSCVDELEPPLLASMTRVRKGDVLFFDIETTGLIPNTYVFLCGLMYLEKGEFVVEQLLARDYAEEVGVLACLSERFARFPQLITFNGVSFDVPFVKTRMDVLRVPCSANFHNLDLYGPSKRAFSGILPNNRLMTIERHLRGVSRRGDIPGRYIPDAYHQFVHSGDARKIRSILYHNRMDLLATASLLNHLADRR